MDKESGGDLDLREEAVVAARTEEEVDGVVGGVVAVAEANNSRSAADGRPAAAVVGAAIPHPLSERGRVSNRVSSPPSLQREKHHQQSRRHPRERKGYQTNKQTNKQGADARGR